MILARKNTGLDTLTLITSVTSAQLHTLTVRDYPEVSGAGVQAGVVVRR